jgi:adenylate cyclase, class 2
MSDKQNLEVEVKLRVRNVRTLRNRLAALGWTENVARSLEENWTFDFPDQQLRRRGQLLRIRQFANQCLLTFKGPPVNSEHTSEHFKIREELETEVQNCQSLRLVLERIGMAVTFRYQKFRTFYSRPLIGQNPRASLTLDETPIGGYLEIEGSENDIERIAAELGYRKEDFITESYIALFLKSNLVKKQRHMVFADRDRREENP